MHDEPLYDPLSDPLGDPLSDSPPPVPAAPDPGPEGDRRFWQKKRVMASTLAALVLLLFLAVIGDIPSLARSLLDGFSNAATAPIEQAMEERAAPVRTTFTFEEMNELHPDRLFSPYTAGPLLVEANSAQAKLIQQFRDLLILYEQRQGEDDNFTIRVFDNRNGETLELYTLDNARARYEETGEADWDQIDRLRRDQTNRLVQKWMAQGVPKPNVAIRWGRANQVREARQRELPTIEYEVRLADYLGLSLLPTEIGTVETFNNDRLVSTVGARSRYQMMPYLLRTNGLRHYTLRTATGRTVEVFDEWHPLLVLEPAMTLVRGYANAVGHEIPGVSAYHTGPGNIYAVYRKFLASSYFTEDATVMDAYMWAVTEGFDEARQGTGFGTYSRGYVASAYGALRALDDQPIDTTQTWRLERVQLKSGAQIQLSELLEPLQEAGLQGAKTEPGTSLYNQFRHINPHITLPAARDSLGVPIEGDVLLTATAGGAPVRFFLPLGASAALAQHGLDVLDSGKTRRFDRDTFAGPGARERLSADLDYDRLVADIRQFGFTNENRRRLLALADEFERLAAEHPDSHYRRVQLEVITTHKQMWQARVWERLAEATSAATGRRRVPAQPPQTLGR